MEYAAEPRSRVGEVLAGKYHLERLLGSGGMGAVYEALHAFTQRRVAVKLMHPNIARSKVASERFLREARAPGSIGHSGIVEVLDGGHADDGSLYLVMEVLRGETLSAAMRARRMHVQEIAAIVLELLDILEAAHGAGFVHRDIKPENVFLQDAGDGEVEVKLLDFGVAGVIEQSSPERSDPKLTRAGAVLGTPLYMSPEQALGRTVDARADLWSVGALLYQALAGAPPYNGNSFHELVVSIATQEHVPIGALRPDLPPRVHAVIERALRKDPSKRWSSAREMAGALMSAVEGRSTAHDDNTLGMSALPSEPSAAPPPAAPSPSGEELPVLRMIVLGMGAVIVLGAIGYIVMLGPWSRADAHGSSQRAEPPALEAEPASDSAKAPALAAAPEPKVAGPAAIEVKEVAPPREEPARTDVAPVPVPVPVTAPAPPPAPEAHGLSSESLAVVLSSAQGELQRCYEHEMVAALTAGQPALPALAFDVSLRVSPAGRVERAQVTATQHEAPPALRACLQDALDGLRFPVAGAASEARFPVVFQPAVVGP